MKKLTATILVFIMVLTLSMHPTEQRAQAATTYIKVDAFIKNLVTKMKLPVDKSIKEPYIQAAKDVNILKDGDFTKYSDYLTRTDLAVLINRADEYLNGDTVDTQLLKTVLKKRISDIKKIKESKREDVAKAYAKGFFKGYSNGYYIQNREFRGSLQVSIGAATTAINLLLKPSKRAGISPDGMLIRTTNLPKNANRYEYILECYPNSFYEKQFDFMINKNYKKEFVKNKDYCYPGDMKKFTFRNWYDQWSFKKEMDKYLYDWADMAEQYLNYIFNVDYKTVGDKWIEGLAALFVRSNRDREADIRSFYIDDMKANKVVVESSIIAVEPSTLYYYTGWRMRAYVKYRITAKDINVKQNKLLYSQYPMLDNLKSGEWRTGVFDVLFATNNGSSGDGSDFAIDIVTYFVDAYNIPVK